VQASETTALADLSDFQILKVRLYRSRGGGWFPSDPQWLLLTRLERRIAAGEVVADEFPALVQQVAAMATPYPKRLRRALLLQRAGNEP
jgi:hypothetical protein